VTLTGPVRRATASRRVGIAAACLIAAVYIGVALDVRIPADTGTFSDEWTYAMMADSLAHDGDLAYRAEDLRRVLAITPQGPAGGPQGVFLKPGVDVTGIELVARPPFFRIDGRPDPDTTRLFFGKAFIYPLVAAPFVLAFGLNGFLWLNALLLAAAFLVAYLFVGARSGTAVSLILAGAFVLATVVPVYYAWTMPELFNFTLGLVAYFLWLYKYVAPHASSRRTAWLRSAASDTLAAAVIGVATYSKPTNVLLFLPMALWLLWRVEWRRVVATSIVVLAVGGGLFAVNVAVTGDWNYQGRPRHTYYQNGDNYLRAFPFQQAGVGFDAAGAEMERSAALETVIFDPELFWYNLRWNLVYFFVGRYGGLIAYFFPVVLGLLLFAAAGKRRQPWQWCVLLGLVAQTALALVLWPYTYLGSAGSVGNRYFMGAYGAALFLFPPMTSLAGPLLAWIVGLTFVGKIILHPFEYSLRNFEPAKSGPLKLLPIELTNLNDLPARNEANRVRVWYGETGAGDRGFQVYHFDDNAYLPEEGHKSFWIKGESRAEMIFKTDMAVAYKTTVLHLSAGEVGTDVDIDVNGNHAHVSLKPGEETDVTLPLGTPFVYGRNKDPNDSDHPEANMLWRVTIASSRGFTPHPPPDGGPADTRYLGVRVQPTVWP
jgi:hypothetical protein